MRFRSARALAAATLLAALSVPAAAQTTRPPEFPFAVGAGGFTVNDTGRGADVKSFTTGGFHAFGEVVLDPGVLLQVRYESFTLPGSAVPTPPFQTPSGATSPHVKVDAGSISVGYLFRENWWEAGFFGGVGIYNLSPREPGAGQVAVDANETVIGWHGGLLAVFQVVRRLDLRVEAAAYTLRSDSTHTPILFGASLAYHF